MHTHRYRKTENVASTYHDATIYLSGFFRRFAVLQRKLYFAKISILVFPSSIFLCFCIAIARCACQKLMMIAWARWREREKMEKTVGHKHQRFRQDTSVYFYSVAMFLTSKQQPCQSGFIERGNCFHISGGRISIFCHVVVTVDRVKIR